MTIQRTIRYCCSIGILLLLQACNPIIQSIAPLSPLSPTPTTHIKALPTVEPSPSATIKPSPSATIKPSPSPTVKPSPSPTVFGQGECPTPNKADIFARPTSLDQLKDSVLTYLNQGGQADELQALLTEISDERTPQLEQVDLTGDGVEEIFLAASIYNAEFWSSEGGLFIYRCRNGKYWVVTYEFGSYIWQVNIIAIEDLVASSVPELIVKYQWAGTRCSEGVFVLGWADVKWSQYLDIEKSCPLEVVWWDRDQDGEKEIVLTANRTPVIAGEVAKEAIFVYDWLGERYEEVEVIPQSLYPKSTDSVKKNILSLRLSTPPYRFLRDER